MDVNELIAKIKKLPGFAEQVGMILIHNGIVRGFSVRSPQKVRSLKISVNQELLAKTKKKYLQKPGIFQIEVEILGGEFRPGDTFLLLAVAGDTRKNVSPVLNEFLEEIKTKVISEEEVYV